MIRFTSGFDVHNFLPEKLSHKKIVEVAGYVPAQIRIENLINAGLRLEQSRMEEFDLPDGEMSDDFVPDPTRQRNYDLADASRDLSDARSRINSRKASTKVDAQKVVSVEEKAVSEKSLDK